MRTIVVIPARGGSKGIPGKNKRPLAGIPLVARAIRAAKGVSFVDGVYISTDDPEIGAIARQWGACEIKRPEEISGDTASSESALLHALKVIENEVGKVDNLIFVQCTSPFLRAEHIEAVVGRLAEGAVDCAFSASEDHAFLWSIGADGLGRGINHDETKPRQRRQDMPAQYRETGAIYAMKRDSFVARGSRFCGKAVPVPVDADPFEIDTPADWARAEALAWQSEVGHAATADAASFKAVRVIVTDFDGVHTDDKVIVDENGRESVVCSRRDGMGIERLRKAGHRLLILSKEKNHVVARRAEKLGVEVIHGVEDKPTILGDWLNRQGIGWGELIYVGNDINDVECMKRAAIAFAPRDSHHEALLAADYVLPLDGGEGALRAMSDMLTQIPIMV